MSTSRRSSSGRGPSQKSSGARRPRVAGLRRHTEQHSSKPDEQEPVESQETPSSETDSAGDAESEQPGSVVPAPATDDSGQPERVDSGREEPGLEGPEQSEQPEPDLSPSDEEDGPGEEGSAGEGDGAGDEDSAGESHQEPTTASQEAPAEDGTAEESTTGAGASRTGRRLSRPATLLVPLMLVLTVAFAGLAVWFQTGSYYSLRSGGATTNRALVDHAATSEAKGQISTAVEKLFSYNYADTAKTEKAAKNLLVDGAVKKYDKLFATVRKEAPKQKLVVSTTVQAAGVTRLQENRAEVLVFVNQRATRNDNGQSNVGPAQLSVLAEKHGDQWKISRLTPR
ncbi:Mce-associated membrane protein [Halopolyspora algeriensis]|uniref:Mce-associated membrane protein n=1 Tax=Halopolyspora algeriensis TaxID=1500506 RepID=A0A368VX55_9ACTN|nr:hypothetical protein [Halopolyspora algeriensis]RCW46786.1 Mce-associated membrane protein [Halopolyspora algeriensis]TQM39204.1 Mce-associated membrane protein [Halopolyspora algeriensis]